MTTENSNTMDTTAEQSGIVVLRQEENENYTQLVWRTTLLNDILTGDSLAF